MVDVISEVDSGTLERLRDVVGDVHLLTEPSVTRSYSTDWTGRFGGPTPAVVRPGDHDEVAELVRLCNSSGVAIVPQGGNTGLVGGSVPLAGEIVMNLRRLDQREAVDSDALQVTAGAGVTIGDLQRHAAAVGLAYGVDLASRDSATVGGTIATNAGGVHLVRYGGTRRQLLGVRAVLADGSTISHLDGLPKDNTGYDVADLLCGSEGTLAVITCARLRLVPRYEEVVVALLAFDSMRDAVSAVATARRSLDCLNAAEVFFADGLELVCASESLPFPFAGRYDVYVLVEAADHSDPTDRLAQCVEHMQGVRDVAVATDEVRRRDLWAYREQHTAAINAIGPPHKLDVTVAVSRLATFVDDVRESISEIEPSARAWLFGHVADGNIHVNVTGIDEESTAVDDAVLRLVARYRGSISAEHGIGTAKKPWLHLNRSETEIATFRAIKAAFDPNGILNPNVLLP